MLEMLKTYPIWEKLFFAENSWIQWYYILVSNDENSWNKNGNSVIGLIISMF